MEDSEGGVVVTGAEEAGAGSCEGEGAAEDALEELLLEVSSFLLPPAGAGLVTSSSKEPP